jgi:hypothetical protein
MYYFLFIIIIIITTTTYSDKTVRLFKWQAGDGFVEQESSPLTGHKYAVTKTQFSPKVTQFMTWICRVCFLYCVYNHRNGKKCVIFNRKLTS